MIPNDTGNYCVTQAIPAWQAKALQATLADVWDIHKKIRYYRDLRGLSYLALAKAAGYDDYQTAQQWEHHEGSKKKPTTPRGKRLGMIAAKLGVSVGELYSPDPPPNFKESAVSSSPPAPISFTMQELWDAYCSASEEERGLMDYLVRSVVSKARSDDQEGKSM